MNGEKERVDAYLAMVARLEPDIAMIDADAFYASAAISLKRIADALDKRASVDDTMEAAEIIKRHIVSMYPSNAVATDIGFHIINSLAIDGFKVIR